MVVAKTALAIADRTPLVHEVVGPDLHNHDVGLGNTFGHLDLLARAHGIPDADDAVDEVLHEVQLVPQSGQLPGTLSSGQRRRLALATAFIRPRKLLILDEPEQRLDTEGVAWLAARLVAERQRGLAIVMASHEPSLVEKVATRVVRLGDRAEVLADE
mgnify:CR=1 FL=1